MNKYLHKISLLFLYFCVFATFSLKAQQTVAGFLTDNHGKPLSFAAVVLFTATDSTQVKVAITDDAGRYTIENIDAGIYLISASMVGYKTAWTKSFAVQQAEKLEVPTIVMTEGLALDEVVVRGKKSLYQLKKDRIVMNIDASPALSGNTGLEILQKTPGVIVDRQNNSISMNTKGEVLMMINNKVQRVPKAVLMAQLQGMRAENIDRVEIIHQPPAKYDASGAAGIINIVLKKNNQQGTNGSMALTGGYGQREKAGFNLNLNSRKGKFNWYGDYNYTRNRANDYEVNHYREYEYLGNNYYHQNLVKLRNYSEGLHTGNLGLDMDFAGRTVIGFLLGGSMSELVSGSNAESSSFDFVNDQLTGEANYLFDSKTDISSFSANANVLQKIGSGSELNFNLDYANYRYDNSGGLENKEGQFLAYTYDRSTPMEFWITTLDYVNPLGDFWTLETGVKGTFNNTVSSTSMNSLNNETGAESNLFPGEEKIDEQILAAYLSFKGKLSEKLNVELGIRYEKYTYKLERTESEDVNRKFENPFPDIRLNYEIDSLNTFQLGFNRSITRPSFNQLSRFILILDPSLIVYSNPRLRPTFTNTFRASWQHNSVILTLDYLNRKGLINYYNTVDKENNIQTSVPINFDQENIIEANLIFPLSPARWWEMNWTLNAEYQKVKDASNHPMVFEKDIVTFSVQFNSSFLFGNNWIASIDGRYRSPHLSGDQVHFNYPYLNLNFRKKFPSGSSLSIAVLDITNTSGKIDWEYHQPELGIRTYGDNNSSERQVRITYTYLFGNQKLSGKRQRKTGADEIKKRM